MEKSGYFDDVDLESFRTTIVGFLREPATICSVFAPIREHIEMRNPWRENVADSVKSKSIVY